MYLITFLILIIHRVPDFFKHPFKTFSPETFQSPKKSFEKSSQMSYTVIACIYVAYAVIIFETKDGIYYGIIRAMEKYCIQRRDR